MKAFNRFQVSTTSGAVADSFATECLLNEKAFFYGDLFHRFSVSATAPYIALNRIFEDLPCARTLEDYERLADYLLKPELTQSG